MILFIDPVCAKGYTLDTLDKESMGGTEATVLRIAKGLVEAGNNVVLAQRNRTTEEYDRTLKYYPLDSVGIAANPKVVVTLRDAGIYQKNVQLYSKAKHYLWLHDAVSGDYRDHLLYHLAGKEANIIVGSDWHKQNVIEALKPILGSGSIKITRVYNPVAEYCTKLSSTEYDPFKLVFFSSPHKGLDYVLKIFRYIKNIDDRFHLSIANPGYYDSLGATDIPINNLGTLPHRLIIDQVRGALCTFYPQTTFPETFGLVMAESNAVGTPVIAHPIGAAREVLEHPAQLLDCREYKDVVDRVISWSKGYRPILKGNPNFTLYEVMKQWKQLMK